MKTLAIMLFLALFLYAEAFAAGPVKPSGKDKCPVCGMFVAKYPDFLAEIIFKDGSHALFDGPKDMFRYYFNMSKYDPSKKKEDIASIYVTGYYDLTLIDGLKAFYVAGSDVMGPMGKELIPFEKKEQADEFMSDHAGKSLLNFNEITFETVKGLE